MKAVYVIVCAVIVGVIAWLIAREMASKATPAPVPTPTPVPAAPASTTTSAIPATIPAPAPAPVTTTTLPPATSTGSTSTTTPAPTPTPTPTPAPAPTTTVYLTPTLVVESGQAFLKGIPAPYDTLPVWDFTMAAIANPLYHDYFISYKPGDTFLMANRFTGSDSAYLGYYPPSATAPRKFILNPSGSLIYGSF